MRKRKTERERGGGILATLHIEVWFSRLASGHVFLSQRVVRVIVIFFYLMGKGLTFRRDIFSKRRSAPLIAT